MALVEVSCPGCGVTLKASETMAGKRVKCKKCDTRFVIPGATPAGDTAGDSVMLSGLDGPAIATPTTTPTPEASAFDFGSMFDAPAEPKKVPDSPKPEPKKSTAVAKPEPRPEPKPTRAPVPPPPPAAHGEFDFFGADTAVPEPPPKPKPADAPKAKSIPKAPALPPDPPQAKSIPKAPALPPAPAQAKSIPKAPALLPKPKAEAAPAATAAGGFDFGAMLDEPPTPKPTAERTATAFPNDDDDVPQAESVQDNLSLDDEPEPDSDDPFGFPGGASSSESDSPSTRGKGKVKVPKGAASTGNHRGYKQQSGGGKMKLILAGVGVLLLGGAIAGVAMFVNKQKANQSQTVNEEDKDKKGEPAGTPDGTKNDPTPPDAKGAIAAKKDPTKKGPTGKNVPLTTGGIGPLPNRPTLVLDPKVRPIALQALNPKLEVFVEPNGMALPIDAEFTKVRRLMAPTRTDMDIGILWEREGVPNTPGNKLVMDVCRPSGTRQAQIEFTGDGKPVPAADLSEDGRWFAHGDGSKVTVWKVEDKSKLIDAWDVYAALPAQQKAGLAAVYFPTMPKDKKDAPPDHLVTVATDGAVHLWNLADRMQLGSSVPPRGQPGRVVEGRGVVLSQLRGFVVVAVGGSVFKVTVEGGNVNASEIADLKADVPTSLGVATYGETTVYAFETGTDKKERAVMVINRDGKTRTLRWPDQLGMPVGVGWISGDLVAVSTNQGGAVLFDYDEEKFSFLPKYAVMPSDKKAIHATTDVCHWYLIPNATNPMQSQLVQISPPAGAGLLDEPNKGGAVPLGRLDARGFSK